MIEDAFEEVYTKFKLYFYRQVFQRISDREATLTTLETFCMEIIYALDSPTINEFASFLEISSPNATYKINSLIQKGYLEKIQSTEDKREYFLKPTQKFFDYYNLNHGYIEKVTERMKKAFSKNQIEELQNMLEMMSGELMPEVNLSKN